MPIHNIRSRTAIAITAVAFGASVLISALSCSDDRSLAPRLHRRGDVAPTPPSGRITFIGAGDMVKCSTSLKKMDLQTAALVDSTPGTVFTIGDNVYESGTDSEFVNCYGPSWGRFKSRTYPVTGNHEYALGNANGYFNYYGAIAGDPTQGYYSYNLGSYWHVVVLNSNGDFVPIGAGSAQELWLKADLAANPLPCTIALWHHPRFYSNSSTDSVPGGIRNKLKPFWDDLYAANAEIIINAHVHTYERFAPMDNLGNVDTVRGLQQFLVGTGGRSISMPTSISPNSLVQDGTVYGVLKLSLDTASYHWDFVPAGGQKLTFSDSGTARCH
jgi:hypothetical protein